MSDTKEVIDIQLNDDSDMKINLMNYQVQI